MTPEDLKAFIERCGKGEPGARAEFQERYGPLIYTFPVRIYHLTEEEAGDFYLYAFEHERIFQRIKSFEGRNNIQFETYLSYYVLRDLCLEWMRTTERVESVSLEAPLKGSETAGEQPMTLLDVLATEDPTPDADLVAADEVKGVEEILHQLEPEKRLVLKLLALGVVELEPNDIRLVAHMTSRSILESMEVIDEVTAALAARAMKVQERQDTLHTVAYWILTYQREIAELEEKIHIGELQGNTRGLEKSIGEKAEFERKLAWRYQQQNKLQEELLKSDIRPSYKDIARILNVPLGTICSKIARAREEFGQKLAMVRDERA